MHTRVMASALPTTNTVYGAGVVDRIMGSAGENSHTEDAARTETIYVGSRKSKLALWQTEHVVGLLRQAHPSINFEITTESTHGDNVQGMVPLSQLGMANPGLFTKELERSLLARRTRLAVHSLKDMPTTLPPGLVLGAITEREGPEDAVVLHERYRQGGDRDKGLAALPAGAVVGTSSLRREALIRHDFPHLCFKTIRGNIHTRLAKLDGTYETPAQGSDAEHGPVAYDAILLAAVGLRRVGLGHRIDCTLPPDTFPHAVGQGALGVECCADDEEVLELLRSPSVHHRRTAVRCEAERAVLRGLQGGCQIPLGVHTILHDVPAEDGVSTTASSRAAELELRACVLSRDGSVRIECNGRTRLGADEEADARAVGEDVARKLVERGAAQVLQEGTRPITYSQALLDPAEIGGDADNK